MPEAATRERAATALKPIAGIVAAFFIADRVRSRRQTTSEISTLVTATVRNRNAPDSPSHDGVSTRQIPARSRTADTWIAVSAMRNAFT